MHIDVARKYETDRSITGEISVDGQEECFCLEPARTTPVNAGHPCVTAGGPYKVILTYSPHLGYICPEVLNVPGRSSIRLHKGNKPEDTLGCVLAGSSLGPQPDWVSNSRDAFDKLMILFKDAAEKADPITITYHDPQWLNI